MFKNRALLRNAIFLIIPIFLGCNDSHQPNILAEPHCLPTQSTCSINTQFGTLDIAFNVHALIAETPFNLVVSTNNHKMAVLSGYMEGTDMFMGKIPLLFTKQAEGNYIAKSMFGSCAKKIMPWRVWVTIERLSDKKQQTVFFTVTSYQSSSVYQQSLTHL